MSHDFMVIGAGISGAAAADALAAHGSVVLLEAESTPGYHSTGRSAALFTPHYGGQTVRAINRISRAFFEAPPGDFCDQALLSPRGALSVAAPGFETSLDEILALSTETDPVHAVGAAEALERAPFLQPGAIAAAAFEPGVTDIDVAALHQGFLRRLKVRGGEILTSFRVGSLTRNQSVWVAGDGARTVSAAIVVNAAGAWADEIGRMAGARPIGLIPKRRSAILVETPQGMETGACPIVDFAGQPPYIKPETGRLMVSPGDETPVEPQDIRTDDYEIAVLVDWFERQTTIPVRRIAHQWAGLRSFVADQVPVAGFDDEIPGFFWLAGQGGFGIMMSPALAELTASLIVRNALPDAFKHQGLTEAMLGPGRCR